MSSVGTTYNYDWRNYKYIFFSINSGSQLVPTSIISYHINVLNNSFYYVVLTRENTVSNASCMVYGNGTIKFEYKGGSYPPNIYVYGVYPIN